MRTNWKFTTAVLFSLTSAFSFAQTTGSFTNAGLTLHYTTQGKGAPVVLLSGGPGMDAAYMQPVADIVARDHTAILLDQRGTTGSMPATLDASTLSPELMLADLEALRTALGYKQWIVLGHSAGSMTAMNYAIAHPECVKALVLVGAIPPKSKGLGRMMDNAMPRMAPDAMQKLSAIEADKTLSADAKGTAESNLFFAVDFYDRAAAAKFVATQTVGTFHTLTADLLQKATPTFDLTPGLAKLHIPTLILQAARTLSTPKWLRKSATPFPARSWSFWSAQDTFPGSKTHRPSPLSSTPF